MKKYLVPLLIVFLLISFLAAINNTLVFTWSNGGFSSNPSAPDHGTHDWIAQHALDWLPQKEKQFILDNLASYLYGTELPDNWNASDGIGDVGKHHVYYFEDGTLQDNASAERAQEIYFNAMTCFKNGYLANASKTLGIMTHYISDLAVFAHVMGNDTDWGNDNKTRHDRYEQHVDTRTDHYEDEFNHFLKFDGALTNISAYDAALALAYNTTFGVNGNLTCGWMNENYDWSNLAFENRCGESLNLAVNAVADVLHTFFIEMQGVAHFINVPFHYQDIDYYCGPACLEMVFDYYGENISQFEIADVARTIGEPVYSTYTDEMVRAAHFSNISTSQGEEIPDGNITGYSLRKLGYAAFENHGMSLTQLKGYIDEDKPLILLMFYRIGGPYGHFRVVTGYNETHIFVHDPWNNVTWGGRYGGANIVFNYTAFLDLWSYYGYWALCTLPWTITVSAPNYIKAQAPFQINATIGYPQPLPDALNSYPSSSCNATITLPANPNITLVNGETFKKILGTGDLQAGANLTVSWMLIANSSGTYTIGIMAEGLVSGSVWPHENYTAYDYIDRIGASVNVTVQLIEDSVSPLIGIAMRIPGGDVQPNQKVELFVIVTDAESGVKNVTLYYNLNDSQTWTHILMSRNSNSYNGTIPGQPEGTFVRFKIVAYDYVGNNATLDGESMYQIVPEFPSTAILIAFLVLALAIALSFKKRILKFGAHNKV